MKPGISPESFEQLRAQSQRCLIDFLHAELHLGFTFAEAAAFDRDRGNAEHSRHTKEQAAKAAANIHHFLDRVAHPEIRDAIAARCAELEEALAAVKADETAL